jgi:hypothetical protein
MKNIQRFRKFNKITSLTLGVVVQLLGHERNVARVGWMWWLTPIVLATWETAIRRITVQGQPKQKVQPVAGYNGVCLSSQLHKEAQVK